MAVSQLSPADAQSANITDEEVIANCSSQMQERDQWLIAQQRYVMQGDIGWRDVHLKAGNSEQAASFQQNIDKVQREIAELESGDPQSQYGWLHGGGRSMVDLINTKSAATLRQWIEEERPYAERRDAGRNPEMGLRACAFNLRIAKLEGRSGAQTARPASQPQPMLAPPPTRSALNAPAPIPSRPAPSAPAGEPQFGGGAVVGPKSVVADTQPVSQCVAPHAAGEKGNFGKLENKCGFAVAVRFCNDKTKEGSWEASMACTGSANWGGFTDIAAHELSSDHVGGQVYWFACRKPSGVTDAKFVPGKGITARCR